MNAGSHRFIARFSACILLGVAALAGLQPANAGAFINMDFEQATVVVNDPTFGFLDWSLAVPGWSARLGQIDNPSVYYGLGHVGLNALTMLLDNTAHSFQSPVAGNYSLLIRGAAAPEYGDASIIQTGDIPAFARAIELRVAGVAPQLYIGNHLIPLIQVSGSGAGNLYAGNITPYAGTTSELRISYPPGNGLPDDEGPKTQSGTLDSIQFTARVVVPEPSTYALAAAGAIALMAVRRRKGLA